MMWISTKRPLAHIVYTWARPNILFVYLLDEMFLQVFIHIELTLCSVHWVRKNHGCNGCYANALYIITSVVLYIVRSLVDKL